MYRLMVVDDEAWIREGIARSIPWEKYGITVCGTASNAAEAMEKVRALEPDVVVTDIVMHGATGVELCGWIRREREDIKVIMLSGYDEFSYARDAMGEGAFDYLLKPVEEDVLVDTVERAARALDRERDREERAKRYTTSLDSLKQLFYMKLLEPAGESMEIAGDEGRYLNLDIGARNYACALWRFGEKDPAKLDMVRTLMERGAGLRLPEVKTDSMILGNRIVFLCSGEGDMQTALYGFFRSLDTIPLLIPDCGCCISRGCEGLHSLKGAAGEAVRVLANQLRLRGVARVQELEKSQREHLEECRACIQAFAGKAGAEQKHSERGASGQTGTRQNRTEKIGTGQNRTEKTGTGKNGPEGSGPKGRADAKRSPEPEAGRAEKTKRTGERQNEPEQGEEEQCARGQTEPGQGAQTDICRELVQGILQRAPGIGKAELGSILFQAMSETAARYRREGMEMENPVTENNEAVSWVFSLESPEQAVSGLRDFLRYLGDSAAFQGQEIKNYLIGESVKYVEENFARDLSADELSGMLGISRVYFSQLFSREMGCTFTKYLTRCRMNRAMELLRHTNNRIYEIAEECGYSDVKYFLKVFKKMTGVSPQAYREHAGA